MKNPDLVLQKAGYSQSPTHSRLAECGSQAIQAMPDHPDNGFSSQRFSSQYAIRYSSCQYLIMDQADGDPML